MGIDDLFCRIVESVLKDRKQKVSVHGHFFDWIKLHQGVPQGTILSPWLFNLYVNDIDQNIEKHCQRIQNADDTIIFAEHNELREATENFQRNVEKLQTYIQQNE